MATQKKQKNSQSNIEPQSWYSLQDVVQGRMLADLRSFESVRNVVQADRRHKNLLKAVITGLGKGTKYRFKGENIIKFKEAWESGSYRLYDANK